MTTTRHALRQLLLTTAFIVWLAPQGPSAEPAAAREPEDSAPKDKFADDRLKYMTKALQKYTVVLDGDAEKRAALDPKVKMRWSNPLGDVVDGLLTVYTTGPAARPAMIAHFHLHGPLLNGLEMHEFADVHPGPVELVRGRRTIWSPKERFARFQKLPDAPQPSTKAPLRLAQIKSMAERFEVIDRFRQPNSEPQPEVLRMMARPTYRYGKDDEELVDGALFTYVLATDPEACLVIEIHRRDDKYEWVYMFCPMTIYSLDAKLDGKPVWTKPEAMVFNNSAAPHYIAGYGGDLGEASMRSLVPMPER
ncbi:MAG TPA: hypothetical protein VKU82_09025 [Planctomycetaceae bacterium]|nr:hypothetical protein [Planctomycetaceae bacterium]